MTNPEHLPLLGRIGALPCKCTDDQDCHVCKVREAMEHLEEVYFDDTKRAEAVHALVRAIKDAAQ